MRKYTKEEISQIVSEFSKEIAKDNLQIVLDELMNSISEKSNKDALLALAATIYMASQKHCEFLITETLNKFLNK